MLLKKLKDIQSYIAEQKGIQRATWCWHTYTAILATLIGALVGLGGSHMMGSWCGATVAVLYFLAKEHLDEKRHKSLGDWTKPDASGVDPRSDKVGDLLGPIAFWFGLTYAAVLSWLSI